MNKPLPYIYEIEKNGKLLVYYGADHSFDPNHKQWEDIRNHFHEFLDRTTGQDHVVLVEGGGNTLKENELIAIKEGGEPLFTTFIAHQARIESLSPEPNEVFEINQLLKTFTKDEIMHYYFSRLVDQWHRYNEPRPNFAGYINHFLDHYKQITTWQDFEFTINNLKEIHLHITGKRFDDTTEEQRYHMIWPMKYNWISNKVSAASSKIRNDFIKSEIKRYWDQGKSIFIVYGQGHAIENEDYLRENLN